MSDQLIPANQNIEPSNKAFLDNACNLRKPNMNRAFRCLLVVALAAGMVGTALGSIQIQVTYTADNVIEAVVKDGGAPTWYSPGANASNWKSADTLTLALDYGHTYDLIFRVCNDTTVYRADGWRFSSTYPPGNSNPAAFLAEIKGTVTGPTLTSTAWEYAIDTGVVPGNFDTDLTWYSTTAWAWQGTSSYNGGSNIWTSSKGGPISGISTSAQWIWGPHNGLDLGTYTAENYLWIRTSITTPIPEPATLIVWSLLGGASWLGMRVVRRGRPAGRQPWSPENRQAFHAIIARGQH
jgi:hypothetical protein